MGRMYFKNPRHPDNPALRMCVTCEGSGQEPVSIHGVTQFRRCMACGGAGWFVPERDPHEHADNVIKYRRACCRMRQTGHALVRFTAPHRPMPKGPTGVHHAAAGITPTGVFSRTPRTSRSPGHHDARRPRWNAWVRILRKPRTYA